MTFEKSQFEPYIDALVKWQRAINLVAPDTISDLWRRHFEDSLSLYEYVKDAGSIADIGSGAGFPGMVLAVAGHPNITLIESDSRKCSFLKEVKRLYGLDVDIVNDRAENIAIDAEVVTCRAFASLADILRSYSQNFTKNPVLFLLKGNNVEEEIKEAQVNYDFDHKVIKKPGGCILKVANIKTVSS